MSELEQDNHEGTLDALLLEGLVCPLSHASLVELDGWLYSTDAETRRRYPIRNGIPVMLIDESEEVGMDAWQAAMKSSGKA
ncbi:MAG: Trm112 family protein [Planctomycetota bacterium]|jgi:uncharacterized protein YbaR (Trm112 family)